MKRLLVFVFLFPIICTSQYTAIPDQNFEQALIDEGYDNVIDGQVSTPNIDAITYLYVDNRNISDLTGIEDFTALTELNCGDNQLTTLDVSNNTALTWLGCSANQLTSLDVSQNIALTYLSCAFNQLTSLDVSQNTALTDLYCGNNPITSLDVSQNLNLLFLSCYDAQLSTLDLSQNTFLTELYCPNNQLTSLVITGCDSLRTLECQHNQLISLDISQNTSLTFLYSQNNQLTSLNVNNNTSLYFLNCEQNQLTSLDLSNNTALTVLGCNSNQLECLNLKNGNNNFMNIYCDNNPYLNCIEVDDPTWATQNLTADPGVIFSTNCNYPAGCFTNSIEEYQSNLSIYPNPTNNLIQIEIENHNGSSEAELYDFTGKMLETTNKPAISLADHPTGIYLLKVSYGDRIQEVKVIKE